jgi:hypothetical protein
MYKSINLFSLRSLKLIAYSLFNVCFVTTPSNSNINKQETYIKKLNGVDGTHNPLYEILNKTLVNYYYFLHLFYSPTLKEGVYRFAHVRLSVRRFVLPS